MLLYTTMQSRRIVKRKTPDQQIPPQVWWRHTSRALALREVLAMSDDEGVRAPECPEPGSAAARERCAGTWR